MVAIQVAVFLLGFLGAARTVLSAVRTFVVPRGDNDRLTRAAFRTIRKVFALIAPPSRPYEYRDRVMAYYGPIALILLPAWWLVLLAASFAAMFWALGLPAGDAVIVSGSSLLTLGFDRPRVPGGDLLRRGGDRPGARRAPDLVPADDLRVVLAARAARQPPRGSCRFAAVADRDDHADGPSGRARRPPRDVGALGAMVR
jgi:hypothetical protein